MKCSYSSAAVACRVARWASHFGGAGYAMRGAPLPEPDRCRCIAIGPPERPPLRQFEVWHPPSYRPPTPLGRRVPKVVAVLAERLDVLRCVVPNVLIQVMRLQAARVSARLALRLQVLPRPPAVSTLRQILAGVCACQRAEVPPLECRKVFQPSVENFARKKSAATGAVLGWFWFFRAHRTP